MRALVERGLGTKISLGGAFGLLHYLDYRTTYDLDGWWTDSASREDQGQIVAVLEVTLSSFGSVRTRRWGDVVSVELEKDHRKVFSFQIASRGALLEPCVVAPWTEVLLDSLPDLVASKMVALVERGAPRDFRDIHAVCQAGLVTPRECWTLWQRREHLTGSDASVERARLAVETHLTRIRVHRPLEQIEDARQRDEAERVRTWVTQELLRDLE
ncbi:MAG: nucleotidyl transferase AbiEii/AbiGii toxin family protein [Planctomycetota bacterium]